MADNTNNTADIEQQYKSKFTVNSGIVTDPYLDTLNEYELWNSEDQKSWVWVNSTTKAIVFL